MCREAEIGHAWPSGAAYDPKENNESCGIILAIDINSRDVK